MGLILSACFDHDLTLAQVGNETIKASDLKMRYNALPPQMQRNFTSELRSRLLDAAIRGKIVEAMAKKEGLDSKAYLQRLMSTDLAVSDQEISEYLKSHGHDFPDRPNRRAFVRASLQALKFSAWLEKAKVSVPVKIDEVAVNSLVLSKN